VGGADIVFHVGASSLIRSALLLGPDESYPFGPSMSFTTGLHSAAEPQSKFKIPNSRSLW
jgi:hypothetical protein